MKVRKFWAFRAGVIADLIEVSIIVLWLSSKFIAKYNAYVKPVFGGIPQPPWAGLAVATSVLSLVSTLLILLTDSFAGGVSTLLEATVFGVLSIFWLATAADATTNGLSKVLGFSGECRSIGEGFRILDGVAPAKIICQQQETVAAFSFIIWLLLLGYVIALVVGCKVSEKHGDTNVWKTSVYHANLFTKGSAMEDGDTIKAKNESSDASTSC